MKVRLGLVLATAALFSGAGCAAPGAGGGGTSAAPSGPVLPGGQVLAAGITPRDNSHTRSADLYLTQAQSTADEVQIQAKYQQALQATQDGIAADPQNAKSYFQAAQALIGIGDYATAATMFDKAEEIYPRYILETEGWRERGWISAYNAAIEPMNSGDMEGAAELFAQATTLYGGRPEALLQLGSIYSQLDRADEAVETFRQAITVLEASKEVQMADTASAPIWVQHMDIANTGLGQVLTYAERYQEAADHYTGLLGANPDDVALLGSLANVLSQLGMPDSVQALSADSVQAFYADSVQTFYADSVQGLSADSVQALHADSVQAFYADSVQALYDRILSRDDLSERELFNAGVGLYQIENYAASATAFSRAAEMNPFNRDAKLNLAQTLSIGEDFEALVPAARELIRVDPRNGLGWIFLTRAYSELDRTEEANAVFNEYQDIGYEVADLALLPSPDGGTRISGNLKNTSIDAGTTVTLRFHFGGVDTREIGTLDISIQTPDVDMSEFFQGDFISNEIVTGYFYEVIAP